MVFKTKKLILKIGSVAFTGSSEKFINTLASLGLRWWQHISVRGLHMRCTVAEVLALEKLSLYTGFSYVHQVLLFHSYGAEEYFRSKRHLLWQTIKAQGLTLIPVATITIVCFSHGQFYVEFSRSPSFSNIACVIVEGRRTRTENNRVLQIFKYVNKLSIICDVLLAVHLSMFILVISKLDAQNFSFTVSLFHAFTRFEHMCSSSGSQNCITQPLLSSRWNKWVVLDHSLVLPAGVLSPTGNFFGALYYKL